MKIDLRFVTTILNIKTPVGRKLSTGVFSFAVGNCEQVPRRQKYAMHRRVVPPSRISLAGEVGELSLVALQNPG